MRSAGPPLGKISRGIFSLAYLAQKDGIFKPRLKPPRRRFTLPSGVPWLRCYSGDSISVFVVAIVWALSLTLLAQVPECLIGDKA